MEVADAACIELPAQFGGDRGGDQLPGSGQSSSPSKRPFSHSGC